MSDRITPPQLSNSSVQEELSGAELSGPRIGFGSAQSAEQEMFDQEILSDKEIDEGLNEMIALFRKMRSSTTGQTQES